MRFDAAVQWSCIEVAVLLISAAVATLRWALTERHMQLHLEHSAVVEQSKPLL